jgi:hypothetical protein
MDDPTPSDRPRPADSVFALAARLAELMAAEDEAPAIGGSELAGDD